MIDNCTSHGCEHCLNLKSLFWEDNPYKSDIREIYVELDSSITVTFNDGNESINIPINNCPKCGRKLN